MRRVPTNTAGLAEDGGESSSAIEREVQQAKERIRPQTTIAGELRNDRDAALANKPSLAP